MKDAVCFLWVYTVRKNDYFMWQKSGLSVLHTSLWFYIYTELPEFSYLKGDKVTMSFILRMGYYRSSIVEEKIL